MLAEVNVAVPAGLSVEDAHAIAVEARHQLLHSLEYLSDATVHIDPDSASGQAYHRITNHQHDDLPEHSH
jgi:divalent metal cation (Fe/Co/Zn/Cd) transporter